MTDPGIGPQIHAILQQLDAWVYGTLGFHLLDFLTSILTIFSELLGWMKEGVDWILKYLS